MKIFNKIILGFLAIMLIACSDELESFKENPNAPASVSPNLLLTSTQVATFANHTMGISRISNMLSQHITGTSQGQFARFGKYDIQETDLNNEWDALYTDAMMGANTIITQYGDANPYYRGMAKIITSINLSYATDLWNQVPYSEAFQGLSGNINPKYETQEQIYGHLQKMLDEAISDLQANPTDNVLIPFADDLIYKGDREKWIKAAYTLKARFALRLTAVKGNQAAQDALTYLQNGFTSNEDDLEAVFGGGGSSLNQWYAFELSRANYIKMGKFFVDLMANKNDPRLPFFAAKDENGGYSGTAPEDEDNTKTSAVGSAIASANSNVGIITYAEAKFIEAEAKFRLGQDASGSLKEAVSASLQKYTGEVNADYINNEASTVDIENIITQKYIALFATIEPYNDFRRTGFPKLTPNADSQSGQIPLRLVTPQKERLYNSNAVVVGTMYENVWWDAN